MRTVSLATLTVVLSAPFVWLSAQVATTSLRGTVFDEKAAGVGGATVTISDPAKGFTRTTKTSAQGEYQFPQLAPADHKLTTTAHGFAALKHTGIKLLVDTPITLNVTLRVAAENITVEVAAKTPLILESPTPRIRMRHSIRCGRLFPEKREIATSFVVPELSTSTPA
ncbi:MAG TPA: carboxypeptidase-like regulatory domain-containing protein [Terriglobales bacterium]|nr:carboxypeptidase-like regulatory domain-containing protein [Terriglobales bacterium]